MKMSKHWPTSLLDFPTFHCLFFLICMVFVMSDYWLVNKFNADLDYVHFIVIVTTVDFVNNVASDSSCQMSLHMNLYINILKWLFSYIYFFFTRCRVLFFPLSRFYSLSLACFFDLQMPFLMFSSTSFGYIRSTYISIFHFNRQKSSKFNQGDQHKSMPPLFLFSHIVVELENE